jgi:hypothetical protein
LFVTVSILGLYNQPEEYSIRISPSATGSGYSSVFYGVLIAEEIDTMGGDKGSRDNTTTDVKTLSETFLNMSL